MTPDRAAQVRVFPDLETLSRAAAEIFVIAARGCAAKNGRFAVALSGGSTPKPLYTLLGAPSCRDEIPWDRTHFFWADERCVPPEHPESNYKLASDAFLSVVPLPAANIHRILGEAGADAAARLYEDELRNFFVGRDLPAFDLVILGAGEDGHTASLFPGSASLRQTERLALPVYPERPKRDRVTLTLPVLNHASQVLFLASGRPKAGIIAGIFDDDNRRDYPAGLVRPVNGEVTWLIDRAAAGELKRPIEEEHVSR